MEQSARRWTLLATALPLITCAAALAGPRAAISGRPAAAEFAFEPYEVVTGSAKRQTVLTGFLLGGAFAELAVIDLDENEDRRLRIYAFSDGTWMPALEATLRPELLFVDVADIAAKAAAVTLFRIHLAMAIGGKGYVMLTGDIASVEAAVSAGATVATEEGILVARAVIAAPRKELFREFV